MSMDDCFIPIHSPLHDTAPPLWRRGSHPCLSQLDLDECASKTSGGVSHGEIGVYRRTLQILNRPVAVPPRRLGPYPGPLRKISPGSEQLLHLQTPWLCKENLHILPKEGELKQDQPSQVTVSHTAPRGRSRAGWFSKDRSTPEDFNMEEHAWRFRFSFPQPPSVDWDSIGDFYSEPPLVMRERRPPEQRNALREKRVAQRLKCSRQHAEMALRKYNKANNTKFELVEIRASNLFFDFGGCHHYNFTAKPEDHHSADGSTKLFFSEVNHCPRDESDILHCCIVGENDAGHCYGCEDRQPTLVHPSSHAYGGGNTTDIHFPGSDGSSSDSD